MRGRIVPFVASVAMLSQAACYDWVAVNPSDAQKLSGSFVAPAGPHTIAVRVVDVQQPDGRLIELSGTFSVRLRVKSGAVYEFQHPVQVDVEGDDLVFRSSNVAPVRVARAEIATLEATKHNPTKQGLFAVAIIVVVAAGATAVALAASK